MASFNRELQQTSRNDSIFNQDNFQNQIKVIQGIHVKLNDLKPTPDINPPDKQKKYLIKTKLSQTDYSKHSFDKVILDSSDSESLVVSEIMEFPPTIKEVQDTILSELDYPQIPLGIIINQKPPISTLILSLFKEFTNQLPIKGFIQKIQTIYYNSKPSISLTLKTNQPHMVASQFSQKHHSKQLKLLLGNDYKMFQINPHPCKNNFFGVIIRGLMMHLCVQEIVQLIKIQIPEVTIESYNSEIMEVRGVGCLMMNFSSLKDCSKICQTLNHSNLFSLQEKEIHVTLNPRCNKKEGLFSLAQTPFYWKRKETLYRSSIQKNQHCTMRAQQRRLIAPAISMISYETENIIGNTLLETLNMDQEQFHHNIIQDMNIPMQFAQADSQYYSQNQSFEQVSYLPMPPPPRPKIQHNFDLIAQIAPPPPPPPPPPPSETK